MQQQNRLAPVNDATGTRGIRFADWQFPILASPDLDALVETVRRYLMEWRDEELACLPVEVRDRSLSSSEEIAARAVDAARAEMKADPSNRNTILLRERSLTMLAAATRLRLLRSLRAREGASRG